MSREDQLQKLHARLDQWNTEIDKLLTRKEALEASTRAEFNRHMDDLRQRRDKAKEDLAHLEAASESAWKDVKSGFESAWEALAKAVESARSRYK